MTFGGVEQVYSKSHKFSPQNVEVMFRFIIILGERKYKIKEEEEEEVKRKGRRGEKNEVEIVGGK